MTTRRSDVDWLRIAAVWLLIPFHAAMIFNPAPFYHVRNEEVTIGMLVFAGAISLWHMPLLFLLAGWSLYASLERRSTGALVRERLARLLVPLVCGVLLYGPAIKYAELRGGQDFNFYGLHVTADVAESLRDVIDRPIPVMPAFTESFGEFLPSFFTRLDRFTWSHLWFLAYLLTFTMLYLPLLRRLATRAPGRAKPWHVWLPLGLLVPIQIFLRPHWPGVQNLIDDWANFAYYTTYLVVGFLFAHNRELERMAHGERRRAGLVALGSLGLLLAGVVGLVPWPPVILAGTAVAGWSMIVWMLGWANEALRSEARGLSYLREASMPVYVLHQAAVVLVGAWVVRMPIGIAPKFLVVCVGAAVLTLATYELLVRRLPMLRLAHGMRAES